MNKTPLGLPGYLCRQLIYLCCYSFWSYELCKRYMTSENESAHQVAMKVLFCGGIAGIVTWASVFPLDVIKTRLQAQTAGSPLPLNVYPEGQSLLRPPTTHSGRTLNSFEIAKEAYRTEGLKVFYRGLGICSIRAFIVNAVQVCSEPLPGVVKNASAYIIA